MPQNSSTGVTEALNAIQNGLNMLRAALSDPEPSRAVHMVSLKEAARRLKMHVRTLRRFAKAGAGEKFGGAWRVDLERLKR